MTDAPATPAPDDDDNAPAADPIKPEATFDDFLKLDLRVATSARPPSTPTADRLLVLQVDAGEGATRQICAGIRAHFQPADLVGRQIVIVANLAPRQLRGGSRLRRLRRVPKPDPAARRAVRSGGRL